MHTQARAVISKFVTPLWPVTLAGIALGALIGFIGFAPTKEVTASTVIRVDEPIEANQILLGTQPLLNTMPDYMSGELAYLSSQSYFNAVAAKLNQSSAPTISAAQTGKSNLVTISAAAAGADDARRMVDAAVTVFTGHVFDQNQQRYQAALDAVNAVIPKLEESERAVNPEPTRPTDELVQLYFQRTSLQVELLRAPGVLTVEPTAVAEPKGLLNSPVMGPLGGGLIGGVIALAGALAWRSRSGVITSPRQLDGDKQVALRPVIRLSGNVDKATARSIYAQLPQDQTGRILVVGVSPESGSKTVAAYISLAAAEHGSVSSVSVTETEGVTDGPETTVIDGGTWEGSSAVLAAADKADLIVIVVRIGYDTAGAVDIAGRAVAHRDVPIAVVSTRG